MRVSDQVYAPSKFAPGKEPRSTYTIGLMGPRPGLDAADKEKSPVLQGIEHRFVIIQVVA
jgi:hypothetical protein